MSGPLDGGASSFEASEPGKNEASSSESSAIVRLVLGDKPARVVLIGAPAQVLADALISHCECQHFDTVEACASASAEKREADMALLWLGAEELDADSALGMTCRLFPQRVLVRVSGRKPVMPASRFYAFGFRRVALAELSASDEGPLLYEYRLADYKQPPDWLNAQFWANPQRFDVLEAEYDDSGKPHPEGNLEHGEDDYEPDEDEYE